MITKNDIIFLNECWINDHDVLELRNFECFSKARKKSKKAKRNSGGICVFIKKDLIKYLEPINWDFEDGLIIRTKDIISCYNKFIYFVFVYMRPAMSTRNQFLDTYDSFDKLNDKIAELKNEGEFILIGDFNARTGNLKDIFDENITMNNDFTPDFISNACFISENDLHFNDIAIERKNEDVKKNDFGHKLIKLCQLSGMIICNGRLAGDKLSGKFTYIDKKGKSTIDYAIISKGLLNIKSKFNVHSPSIFSDHNAISLKFDKIFLRDINTSLDSLQSDIEKKTSPYISYSLTQPNIELFKNQMNDDFSINNLNYIIDSLNCDQNQNAANIDLCINTINHVIEIAARPFTTLHKKHDNVIHSNATVTNEHQKHNAWYDK